MGSTLNLYPFLFIYSYRMHILWLFLYCLLSAIFFISFIVTISNRTFLIDYSERRNKVPGLGTGLMNYCPVDMPGMVSIHVGWLRPTISLTSRNRLTRLSPASAGLGWLPGAWYIFLRTVSLVIIHCVNMYSAWICIWVYNNMTLNNKVTRLQ